MSRPPIPRHVQGGWIYVASAKRNNGEMHLYRGTAKSLREDLAAEVLVQRLGQRFVDQLLYPPGESEVRSWERSLGALGSLLGDAGLDDAEILVEYRLPLASKRIDALLIGTAPSGAVSAVVIENKQWTLGEIESVEDRTVVVAGRRLLHPQQQVSQYVGYLRDFNTLAHDGRAEISGLAFLHNATAGQVAGLRTAKLADVAEFPIFTGDETGAMRSFLTERLSPEGAADAADAFLSAAVRPSKRLLDHLHEQLKGQPTFTLLDEQLVAYDVVRTAVNESRRSNRKKVVAVLGGPGSGKSVIALQLLGDLAKAGRNVSHATGSKSFTMTLRELYGRKAGAVFRYFNNFSDVEPNDLDVVVADEAHRLRESSNHRFTPKSRRSTVPQVDELIQAARVPVFLLDERQVVRPGEIGTVEEIMAAAERQGASLEVIKLDGHFRAAGEVVPSLVELCSGGPPASSAAAGSVASANKTIRDEENRHGERSRSSRRDRRLEVRRAAGARAGGAR